MSEYRRILEAAYQRFHDQLEVSKSSSYGLYSYETCNAVKAADWGVVGDWSVSNQLQGSINGLNAWRRHLNEWRVWISLKGDCEEEEWWQIQHHFLEPIVFFCMYQPSTYSDRLLEVAEFSIHQGNLTTDRSYKDQLAQDKLKPGKRLTKKDRLDQVKSIGGRWSAFSAFIQAWSRIDSPDYRGDTRDFRNLASHSFAPRLTNGQIMVVTREVGPWQNLEPQGDGTCRPVDDPVKKGVSYGFGVLDPLDLAELQAINLSEHWRVSKALDAYCALLEEITSKLSQVAGFQMSPD